MKNQSNSSPTSALGRLGRCLVPLWLVAFIMCGIPVRAQFPPNPVVELSYSEGSGDTTTNTGTYGGVATLMQSATDTTGYPLWTNNVPAGTGPYAPTNAYAINNGSPTGSTTAGTGGWQVNLVTAYDPNPINTNDGEMGTNWPGFTICGWVNCFDGNTGNGNENVIAYALNEPAGNAEFGFELAHNASMQIELGINQNAADDMASTGGIPVDPNAGSNNWVFIAATYDYTLPSNNVSYYFGTANQLAYLDSAVTYIGGATCNCGGAPEIGNDLAGDQTDYAGNTLEAGPLTIGNISPIDEYTGTGETGSRVFRGLFTEFKVYNSVLNINQIQQAQLNSNTVPSVGPSILTGGQPGNVSVPQGLAAMFHVNASGSGTLVYTWQTNNGSGYVNVAGVTGPTLTIPNTGAADAGLLVRVGITNSISGIVSSVATLTVLPANPELFALSFSEGQFETPPYNTNLPVNQGTVPPPANPPASILTTNFGALGGVGIVNVHTPGSVGGVAQGSFPYFSAYVPVGPYAPNPGFNQSSLFMGPYDAVNNEGSQGNRWVDFDTNIISSSGLIPAITGLTICGWVNCGDNAFRSSGATECVLVDALNNPGNVGFRLTHDPSWALDLGINQPHSGGAAQSSYSVGGTGGLPVDITFGTNNWVFFAVTYDGTLAANNVNYYFGNISAIATLDSTSPLTYNAGTMSGAGPVTVGNVNVYGSGRTINGSNSPYFKGYIDQLCIFNTVLTLAQIQALQVMAAEPYTLTITPQPPNVTVTWGSSPLSLLASPNVSGPWNIVTNTPTLLNNTSNITLPASKSTQFFKLGY